MKILILTPGICGSKLLHYSLIKHPQLTESETHEPFNLYNVRRVFGKDKKNLTYLDSDQFYKLFYDYTNKQDIINILYTDLFYRFDEFKEFIQDFSDLNIIHLTRKNITSTILARCFSYNSNIDESFEPKSIGQGKHRKRFFDILNKERYIDINFVNNTKIYYEDLIHNWDYYINMIEKHNSIDVVKLEKVIKKRNRKHFKERFDDSIISKIIFDNFHKDHWSISDNETNYYRKSR